MTYIVQGKRWEHKSHLNQLKQRFTDLVSLQKEVPMEILYDTFDTLQPLETVEPRVFSKRKGTAMEFLNIKPKLKMYKPQKKSSQRGGVIYELSETLAYEY